jgi:hypothetical protein
MYLCENIIVIKQVENEQILIGKWLVHSKLQHD